VGAVEKSSPDLPVVTTANQALMRSDITIMQDGQVKKLPRGNRELEDVKWVYHDKIGYILPEPATVNLSNQTEQGCWSDITDQKNISEEIVNEDVFMLWFNHGNRPQNGSYQYIVVPGVSEQELNETAGNNRNIEILSNTSDIQAVKHNQLGICQIAFYNSKGENFMTFANNGQNSTLVVVDLPQGVYLGKSVTVSF
jgi:chondroitin AC lyase